MKKFKTLGNKIFAFALSLLIMCSLVQIPVYAATSVRLVDLVKSGGSTVSGRTSVTWTTSEILEAFPKGAHNTNWAFYKICDASGNELKFLGQDAMREGGAETPDGTYAVREVPSPKTEWKVVENLGDSVDLTVEGWKLTFNNNNGSGTMEDDAVVKGVSYVLPESLFTAPSGKQFKAWSVDGTEYAVGNTVAINADTEITAVYEDSSVTKYDVTVNGGTGTEKYAKGDTVTITANAPAAGKQFKEWTVVSGGVTLADSKSTTTTFTMPENGVEVTATYEGIVTPTPEKPTITAGAGFTHQISNGKDMTLTCSGKLEDLTGIYVDGKLLDASNYTLKSGSTILTLKASYLDTLSAGKHTLKFQYKDNLSADTEFTILGKAGETPVKPSSPKTGDTSNTMLYIGMIALSGCVAAFGLKKKKSLNK